MEQTEKWVPVVGLEGLYEVSDLGRVRSLDRKIPFLVRGKKLIYRKAGGKMIYGLPINGGYIKVRIARKDRYVHEIVLTSLCGPRPENMECRHLNGIHGDNRLENLKWGTRRENGLDKKWAETPPRGKLHGKDVQKIKALLSHGKSDASIAREYRVGRASIRSIRIGRTHSDVTPIRVDEHDAG